MEQKADLKVTEIDGKLTLECSAFKVADSAERPIEALQTFGGDGFFLRRQPEDRHWPSEPSFTCFGEIDALRDYMLGAVRQNWTGVLSVHDGISRKKIHFYEGSVVFAMSDLIDDRLGEILYREGALNIEQLVAAAAQVDEDTKFGQVLMRQGAIDACGLWDGLCAQVKWILHSLFFADKVYFEAKKGATKRHTTVILGEDSETLVENASSFGAVLRRFVRAVDGEDAIELHDHIEFANFLEGSYRGDLLRSLQGKATVNSFLKQSRTQAPYAMAQLLEAIQKGVCSMCSRNADLTDLSWGEIIGLDNKWRLSNRIDAYETLILDVKKEFARRDLIFPIEQLIGFAARANDFNHRLLVVRPDGHLDRISFEAILGHFGDNRAQLRLVEKETEALIQFLLQLATDFLPKIVGKKIKKAYANMVL